MRIFFIIGKSQALLLVMFTAASLAAFAMDPPGLNFIANHKQWRSDIQFSVNLPGGAVNISPGRLHYYFVDDKTEHPHERRVMPDAGGALINVHAVQVSFLHANPTPGVHPLGKKRDYRNYFVGDDESRWVSGVPVFSGVLYSNLYEGIDLKLYSSGSQLKYDLLVAPGGNVSDVVLVYDGAERISIDQGDLRVVTPGGEWRELQPVAWQYIDGEKVYVRCVYTLRGNEVSFSLPNGYDPCYELTIDPLLIFSTYSGSTADNWGSTATPGEGGTLYSAGATRESMGGKFPATAGVFQTTAGQLYDIGVLKYDSAGSTLLYASYLGGAGLESAHSLVMDYNEDLIVLGTTSSTDFATTEGAFDNTFNGGPAVVHVYEESGGYDIFISRISRDGTELKASSYFGGSMSDGLGISASKLVQNYGDELRGDIITDRDGNVYVSSVTSSTDFPMVNSFEMSYGGGQTDALLLKIAPDLSVILWSAFLGGTGDDAAYTLKLDRDNNIFIAGGTTSSNFPVTSDTYRPAFSGQVDGWIAKVASDGSSILHATYMGTSRTDQIYFLDLNSAEEPHVFGVTNAGTSIPKIPATVFNRNNGGQFMQKYSNDLSSLLVSTTYGSGRSVPDISPTAFLVNDCGNVYMSGWGGATLNSSIPNAWPTSTEGLPVSADAVQTTTSGNDFYFIVLADDASEFLYGTFLGGSVSLTHVDGGTSRFEKNGLVYHAVCSGCAVNATGLPVSDFPTTAGAWSNTNNSANCNNAAFKFDLSSLKALVRTNTESLSDPGVESICLPEKFVFENFSIGGQEYVWDFGDGTSRTTVTRDTVVHAYRHPGQYVVRMKAIDIGTCSEVDSTRLVVNVFDTGLFVQDDDDHCFGSPYRLMADGGISYEWHTRNGGLVATGSNPFVEPSDTTEYFVTILAANGCVRRDSVTINVIPSITPTLRLERLPQCEGRPTIRLSNETDSLSAGDRMFFDLGDGQVAEGPTVDHAYAKDGIYRISLVANREFCVYETSIDVPVMEYRVPNVITPEGSKNVNDKLVVEFGRGTGKTPADFGFNTSLVIYNRWGGVVFESDDYRYDWSGDDVESGVYYFEMTIEDHGTCRSWLHLIK